MPIKSLATGTLLSRTGQDGVSTPAELTIWKCFLCSKVNSKEVEKCLCCGRPKEFAPKSSVYPKKARPFALHGLVSLAEDIRPEQIQSLCQQGQLDINQTDSRGWTALHCAARLGRSLVVRELIKQGASVKMVTIGGWHPLHHAIFGGHIDATAELLEADVEVDVRLDDSGPDDGMTPLHLAASLGHTAIVAMLLECGADFFLVTSNLKRTALHLAVLGNHENCVRILLEKTNLLCIADNEGATPMDIALYSHLPKMVSLLELYTPVGGGKNTLHKEDTGTKKNTNAMDFLISSCPPCMGKFNKR